MPRTSDKIPMCDFFFLPHNPDILFCGNLFDHNKHFLKDFSQIKWDLFQDDLTRLKLTHIQNIIYQFQQHVRCLFHLCPVFRLLLHIICIVFCHINHATDSIDRGPDIMAHPLEKLCFCLIGGFCLFCGYQKF